MTWEPKNSIPQHLIAMFEDGVDVQSKVEQVSQYGHVSSIITMSNGQEEPK